MLQLLDKCNYDPKIDKLYFLGDAIDRGYDTFGTLKFLRENASLFILGNHEIKAINLRKDLRKLSNEVGSYKIASSREESRILNRELYLESTRGDLLLVRIQEDRFYNHLTISDEYIDWLEQQPLYKKEIINDKPYLFVHAGIAPFLPIDKNKETTFAHIRHVNLKGKPKRRENGGVIHWTELYEGKDNICCGHYIHNLDYPHIITNTNNATIWSLDTGGVFGGSLSALILPEEKIVQIKCKKYCDF
jgi:hypothetical protein